MESYLQIYWLCSRLKHLRLMLGVSTSALASKVGVSRTQISDLESARHDPRLGTVIRQAEALGFSLGDLVDGLPSAAGKIETHPRKILNAWLREDLEFEPRTASGMLTDIEFVDQLYRIVLRHKQLQPQAKLYLEVFWKHHPNNQWKSADDPSE